MTQTQMKKVDLMGLEVDQKRWDRYMQLIGPEATRRFWSWMVNDILENLEDTPALLADAIAFKDEVEAEKQ